MPYLAGNWPVAKRLSADGGRGEVRGVLALGRSEIGIARHALVGVPAANRHNVNAARLLDSSVMVSILTAIVVSVVISSARTLVDAYLTFKVVGQTGITRFGAPPDDGSACHVGRVEAFHDPLSFELLTYPIVASDGYTYDLATLQKWCTMEKQAYLCVSPFTKEKLLPKVILNRDLLFIMGHWQTSICPSLSSGVLPNVVAQWLDDGEDKDYPVMIDYEGVSFNVRFPANHDRHKLVGCFPNYQLRSVSQEALRIAQLHRTPSPSPSPVDDADQTPDRKVQETIKGQADPDQNAPLSNGNLNLIEQLSLEQLSLEPEAESIHAEAETEIDDDVQPNGEPSLPAVQVGNLSSPSSLVMPSFLERPRQPYSYSSPRLYQDRSRQQYSLSSSQVRQDRPTGGRNQDGMESRLRQSAPSAPFGSRIDLLRNVGR